MLPSRRGTERLLPQVHSALEQLSCLALTMKCRHIFESFLSSTQILPPGSTIQVPNKQTHKASNDKARFRIQRSRERHTSTPNTDICRYYDFCCATFVMTSFCLPGTSALNPEQKRQTTKLRTIDAEQWLVGVVSNKQARPNRL
jgi:hypothetical protein